MSQKGASASADAFGAASRSGAALVIVDMINGFEFEGGEDLRPKASATADVILRLRAEADACGAPVIYVNDNYGHWRASPDEIIQACAGASAESEGVVRRLTPRAQDYFVIKPEVSGFYATSLPVLLPKLGASRIILTGVAADICVLFTAADAHMRDYDLWVPADAVASEDDRRRDWALEIMRGSLSAQTRPTSDLRLVDWIALTRAGRG